MIAEFGHFALILAALVALVQSVLPLWGAARGHYGLMLMAQPAALSQFLLLLIAFMALVHGFVVSDFSLRVVTENSHSLKPMLYKVTGTWGNHEGSMLLWVLILALFGACVAAFGGNLPVRFRARVLAVQAMVGVGFLAFILLTSNPFDRLIPAPIDGRDLNPLLQDPGLAFHPPFLYLGYVGLSMAFSFAVAALIEGRVDAAWARWVRPWTLAAWVFLTIGIALGSWWAYYELGWGGWWFWDPVENASFMPWLAATALLHSAIVVEKRGTMQSWTVLLAILSFGLSLIGTFLVRSGVLTSVHAFATSPERGVFILGLLVLAIGGALALYAWRAPQLKGQALFTPISREGALLFNNLILVTATAVVFVGTLYPLAVDAVGGAKISVGPPYFNASFVPMMVPLLLALPLGPMLGWKRGDLGAALSRLWAAGAVALAVMIVLWALLDDRASLAPFGIGLAAWLVVGALIEWAERIRLFKAPLAVAMDRARGLPRASYGMMLAHLGLGVAVAAMVALTAWKQELILDMRPGDRTALAGYALEYQGTRTVDGPNYRAEQAVIAILRDGQPAASLTPERRFYPVQAMTTTEAAIRTSVAGDLYAVIGEAGEDGARTVRLYFNPLAPWLWLGVTIMSLGGFISLSDRRLRVGAPSRRTAGKTPQAATT
ncbi:MAG: heme lyase CcmF/NrfE family subunit [Sphingomonadales bacterium]